MRVRLEALLRPNRSDGGLLTLYDAVTGLQAMTPIPCLGRASGHAIVVDVSAGKRRFLSVHLVGSRLGDTPCHHLW